MIRSRVEPTVIDCGALSLVVRSRVEPTSFDYGALFLVVRSRVEPTVIDYGAFLYDENPDYRQFKGQVSKQQLTQWYIHRAKEIEDFSRQVASSHSSQQLYSRCVFKLNIHSTGNNQIAALAMF